MSVLLVLYSFVSVVVYMSVLIVLYTQVLVVAYMSVTLIHVGTGSTMYFVPVVL